MTKTESILERLRVLDQLNKDTPISENCTMFKKAADEIERLCAENARLQKYYDEHERMFGRGPSLIERLRDDNRVVRGNTLGWQILDEAADEIERLQRVLRLAVKEEEYRSFAHAGDLEWVQQARRCLSDESRGEDVIDTEKLEDIRKRLPTGAGAELPTGWIYPALLAGWSQQEIDTAADQFLAERLKRDGPTP